MRKLNNILVTGGAGFIGSNFIRFMFNQTDFKGNIINVDKLTYAGNLTNLADIHEKYDGKRYFFQENDICNNIIINLILHKYKIDTIIHFAAESHVDNSITGPKDFIETNINGTFNLLECAREHWKDRKDVLFHHVSCYDKKTRALTKDGFKYYYELNENDIVYTLNNNNEIEEQKIEKIIIQDYNGNMIKLKNGLINMNVTPNHRMYDEKLNVFEANDLLSLKKYDNYKLPFPKNFNGINDDIYIDNKKINLCDLFYLSGAFIGDGFLAYQEKQIKNKSGLNKADFIKRRNKKGQFISGKTGNIEKSTCKSYRIFFDVPEKDKARKNLEKVLNNLNIKYTCQKNKSGEHIYITSKIWSEYFKQFGKHAKNKHIPKWMLKYDSKYLKYLYNGLIDTDGHYRKDGNNESYSTVSEQLVADICELGLKIGKYPNIFYNYSESEIDGRKISGYGYSIVFGNKNKVIRKSKITKTEYNDKIWCIKVKNKNFITERDGCLAFSGNTDEVYGSLGDIGYFFEDTAYDPRSPYSASKAASDHLVRAYYHTYGLPVTISNCSNNYGPYQFPEKLIPVIILNILNEKLLPIYGNGQNIRDWLYVDDHCNAIWSIIKNGTPGETYNIGGENEITNLNLINILCEKIALLQGKDIHYYKKLITFVKDRAGHDFRYAINCDKIKKELGWTQNHNFDEALDKTINFYMEYNNDHNCNS